MSHNNPDKQALLSALSSFWLNFFQDKDVLESAYAGSFSLLGEVYFELLESVLTRSLEETPIYSKKYWHPLDLSEEHLEHEPGASLPYIIKLPQDSQIVDLGMLLNKVLEPSVILEKNKDFLVVTSRVGNTELHTTHLRFLENPFTSGSSGDPIDGVPRRWVDLDRVTYFESFRGSVTSGDTLTDTSASFSSLDERRVVEIGESTYRILEVIDGQTVRLDVSDLPDSTEVSWKLVSPKQGWQLIFWAPDVVVDRKALCHNFGSLIRRFEPSSQSYKELIRGVFNFFSFGPDLGRVEAALNVVIGLPLVREDEEILQEFNQDLDKELDIITTDKHTYTLPLDKARDDLTNPLNWGSLKLRAFEALSKRFRVVDSVVDPGWWENIRIPLRLMPGGSLNRRQITPDRYAVTFDNEEAEFKYGDLGLKYGADSDGFVPEDRPPLALKHSYMLFDTVLKNHTFGVFVDDEEDLPRAKEDLESIIIAGSPAQTYVWFSPGIEREEDAVWLMEEFSITAKPEMKEEVFEAQNTNVTYGSSGLAYGQYYHYDDVNGVLTVEEGDPDLEQGENPVVYGGADPNKVSSSEGFADWPVVVEIVV